MKTRLMLCALPLLFTAACTAPADPEETADAGSPYLAKEVVGIHMLSTDRNYDKLAEALPEEFVRNTFKVSEEAEMMVHDQPEGVMYHWGKNHVVVKMGSEKPFASIYQAEAVFNKMLQPDKAEATAMAMEPKPALSGPETEGTGAETPAIESGHEGMDMSAKNDSSQHPSPSETPVATHLTEPAHSTAKGEAVAGLGDKAIWTPGTETLHVLFNNHILNVTVETADNEATKKQRAVLLAEVLLANLTGTSAGPSGK